MVGGDEDRKVLFKKLERIQSFYFAFTYKLDYCIENQPSFSPAIGNFFLDFIYVSSQFKWKEKRKHK